MTEKNAPDIVIFINGRIETSVNFASRCSLLMIIVKTDGSLEALLSNIRKLPAQNVLAVAGWRAPGRPIRTTYAAKMAVRTICTSPNALLRGGKPNIFLHLPLKQIFAHILNY